MDNRFEVQCSSEDEYRHDLKILCVKLHFITCDKDIHERLEHRTMQDSPSAQWTLWENFSNSSPLHISPTHFQQLKQPT